MRPLLSSWVWVLFLLYSRLGVPFLGSGRGFNFFLGVCVCAYPVVLRDHSFLAELQGYVVLGIKLGLAGSA